MGVLKGKTIPFYGHSGFSFLVTANNPEVNILVQYMSTYCFHFMGFIPGSGITESELYIF